MKNVLLSCLLAAMLPALANAEDDLKVFTYYDGNSNNTVDWCAGYGAVKTDIAIEMPAEFTAGFSNGAIQKLLIGTGVDAETGNFDNTDIVVWFSNDLAGEPYYSQNAKLKPSIMVFTEIQLSQPVPIEPGKPLFIGYTYDGKKDKDFGIAGDGNTGKQTSEDRQWVRCDGGEWKHDPDLVGNFAIKAYYSGESSTMPKNMATINTGTLPYYIEPGTTSMGRLDFKNTGDNDITNFEITYCIDGEPVLVKTVELYEPVASKQTGYVHFDGISCEKIGNNIRQSAYISKVNGEPNGANKLVDGVEQNRYDSFLFSWPANDGFKRTVVFEELTGTWCGNCPRGYVTMETMREEHPDGDFIGLAAHAGDQMDVVNCIDENDTSGIPVGPYAHIYYFASGAPEILVNRASKVGNARLENGRTSFEQFRNEIPAYATIDMELTAKTTTVDPPMVSVKAKAKFAGDETDADYRVSLVVSEDNVGPYMQENYYANNAMGECGGFENLPSKTKLIYNDVVRYTDNFDGVEGAFPSTIIKDTEYEYEQSIQLNGVKDDSLAYITALLINGKTGIIENAVRKKVSDFNAININVADNNAPVINVLNGCITVSGADSYSVHTISGIDVTGMKTVSPGIYIVKADNTVRKVVVR